MLPINLYQLIGHKNSHITSEDKEGVLLPPQSQLIFNRIVSDIPENILTHQSERKDKLLQKWETIPRNKPPIHELMGGRMRNVISHRRHRLTTTCECSVCPISRWVVIRLSQEEISHDWSRKYQPTIHPSIHPPSTER